MGAPESDSAAIRQTIRALKAAAWTLDYVDNGEEDIPVKTEQEAIDAITAVDQAWLFVKRTENGVRSYVFFVLGNDPEEVICDHTVDLSPVLDPLTERWF